MSMLAGGLVGSKRGCADQLVVSRTVNACTAIYRTHGRGLGLITRPGITCRMWA